MPIPINISGEYEILSDGMHTATIESVEEAYYPYFEATPDERAQLKELVPGTPAYKKAIAEKKLTRKIVLTWLTDQADANGNTITKKQFLGATLHPKSTLRPVVMAVLEPGEDLAAIAADIEVIKGRKARLYIKHVDDGQGNIKDKIQDVNRFKVAAPVKAAPRLRPNTAQDPVEDIGF